MRTLAHYKRLKEYLIADPEFEAAFCRNPSETLAHHQLDLDVDALRPFWDKAYNRETLKDDPTHPINQLDKELIRIWSDTILIGCLQNDVPTHPNYRAWRQRQKERTKSQFLKQHDEELSHILFAFELTKGCSGKCPFCALAPAPLEKIFDYTDEHARLWRNILQISKDILGLPSMASACYWATDPFDNPDYEQFCRDFAYIHGSFPQTTTVKHLQDVRRTRRFLQLSQDNGGRKFHRFSIISLPMMRQLFEEFSAEELLSIRLVLNNKESKNLYSKSGRARALSDIPDYKEKLYEAGSSACVSGFLVNMPERALRLITPCPPSEQWPFGYMESERAIFRTADDFAAIISGMIEKYMPLAPRTDTVLRFRSDMRFESFADGFQISTKFMKRTFRNDPVLTELGKMIQQGSYTLQQINEMFEWYCLPSGYIEDAVQKMFDAGVFDEFVS